MRLESQAMYSRVSFQLMLLTGRLPRPQPLSSGFRLHPPSAEQASHCAIVTSNRDTANRFAIVTL